jgi:dTDP-4-amino-4,6-dideoxygalactose transaminase
MHKTYVTQPYLPPLEEFLPALRQIWDSHQLTNAGPFHEQFEKALAKHLGVSHIALFSNGTLALVTALQALRITGEVITTPYSFVATSHSLLWNGIKPVFVDIEPHSFGLDPEKIEAAITPQTTAILAVHVYGFPTQVERIQKIADTYGLKVIYDAAHAFGVKHQGVPLVSNGDLSILSFHATKVFNTFEGGAIICPDAKTKQRIDYLKNFGFADETTVVATGINGKMNEFQAALGLLQLQHIDNCIRQRGEVDKVYRKQLDGIRGITIPPILPDIAHNYSYFPILIDKDYPLSRDELHWKFRNNGIFARRYFYPLISEFPMYRGLPSASPALLPVASQVSRQILCLPIYPDLSSDKQTEIIAVIKENSHKKAHNSLNTTNLIIGQPELVV